MKQRIISAMVGLSVLLVAILFFDTLLVNCLAALICVMAVFELFNAARLTHYRMLAGASALYCVMLVFLGTQPVSTLFLPLSLFYVVFCFCYLLREHTSLDIRDLCYCFLTTLLVAMSFYSLMQIRDESTPQLGLFYLVLSFGSAWWADGGAYFVGTFLGKHKLCPTISPKKTIEGLVGGILSAVVFNLLTCWIFVQISRHIVPFGYFVDAIQVNFGAVALLTPPLALLGVLGDLSASVIKRQCGIKDFGHIMPGHGGVMDRFDSVLFISPVVFLIFRACPLISVL